MFAVLVGTPFQVIGKLIGVRKRIKLSTESKSLSKKVLSLKSDQFPTYGVIYFTRVLHNSHPSFIKWPFANTLQKYNPMTFLPRIVLLLTFFEFINDLYIFLPMSYVVTRPLYFVISGRLYLLTYGKIVSGAMTYV